MFFESHFHSLRSTFHSYSLTKQRLPNHYWTAMSKLAYKASLAATGQPTLQTVLVTHLHDMSNKDRHNLDLGSVFTLMVGEETVGTKIPVRAAMAFSQFFQDAFTQHPRTPILKINPDQVTKDCVVALVDFIVGNVHNKKPFGLRGRGFNFVKELDLYHHAINLFGMGRWASPMRFALLDRFKKLADGNIILSYEALNEIVKPPSADPIYQHVVKRMEGLQHIGEVEGDADWAAFLAKQSHFTQAMADWKVVREQRKAENQEVQRKLNFEHDFPVLPRSE